MKIKASEVVLFVGVTALIVLVLATETSIVPFILGRILFPTLDYVVVLAVFTALWSAVFWILEEKLVGLAMSIVSTAIAGGIVWAFGRILNVDISLSAGMFVGAWVSATFAVLLAFIRAETVDEIGGVLRGSKL